MTTDDQKIFFIGLKGVGMTAMALIAKQQGFLVSGCDVEEEFITDEVLIQAGISVKKGFNPRYLLRHDLAVYSAAHGGGRNPMVVAAREKGIKTMCLSAYQGNLFVKRRGISVAGCHGKTTTSAMIAFLLEKQGFDPTYCVGTSRICRLGAGGRFGKGEWLVVEADEYAADPSAGNFKPRFYYQSPEIGLITNIDHDHPDIYPHINQVITAYRGFVQRIRPGGALIISSDSRHAAGLIKQNQLKVVTFGISKQADWRIENMAVRNKKVTFDLRRGKACYRGRISVPGYHNCLNAAAAVAAVFEAGIDPAISLELLREYCGTKRRFEHLGRYGGFELYDDYAHHPEEIKVTLAAAGEWFPGEKIIVIFQPHTYTRTRVFLPEFSRSFSAADFVFISDIFPSAREKPDASVSGRRVAEAISQTGKKAFYAQSVEEVLKLLSQRKIKKGVIMTMGAGDIYKWAEKLLLLK